MMRLWRDQCLGARNHDDHLLRAAGTAVERGDRSDGSAPTVSRFLDTASQVALTVVSVRAVTYHESAALEVRLTGPYLGPDKDTFAIIPTLDFHDGTIEVNVAPDRCCRTRHLMHAASSASRFASMQSTALQVKVFISARRTRARKIRSAATMRHSIFPIPATISTGYAARPGKI